MAWQEEGQSKYNARSVTCFGIKFDSTKEAVRYLELREMVKKGLISDLRLQVPFVLLPAIWEDRIERLKTKEKTVRKCIQEPVTYIADFVYVKDGQRIVEDAKGFKTEVYKIKKKMMRSLLGITILET